VTGRAPPWPPCPHRPRACGPIAPATGSPLPLRRTTPPPPPLPARPPVRRGAIDALAADGGTATGDALSAALDRLEARRGDGGRTAPAAVVLLSDGKTTEGSDPLRAADRARRLRIPVSTVALGTPDGTVPGPMG